MPWPPVAGSVPTVVRTLVSTLVLVPLMTYVVMPRMTRLFQRWLYARPETAASVTQG